MKLLGWMHQKLCQHSREQLMTFTGNPSGCNPARALIDEQLFHAEPSYSLTPSREPNRVETRMEDIPEEDSHDELFHGFLTIGTLGSESLDMQPPTPTFRMSFQNLSDQEIYITENDVKLINDELEKFLGAEGKAVSEESSERSSEVSIINFSYKQLDNENSEVEGYSANCPLQKYLFGNSIELPARDVGPKKKKEKMSLQDLFSISDSSSENSAKKHDYPDKLHKQSYAKRFMKNILKKVHSTGTSCVTVSSAGNIKATKSEATKRKLPKVMKPKFFHRKVHPKGSTAEERLTMAKKDEKSKVSDMYNVIYAENQEKKRSPNMATEKKKETFNLVSYSERENIQGEAVNRERWIKTDDDYLVLEL